MQFQTHETGHLAADLIESIFHFKGFQPDHSIERVVPTGHVFVIFELDGMQRYTYDNETLDANAAYTKAWVSGVHQNYISISAHQDSEMFVIQFKAYGALPFLYRPLHEIAGQVVAADQFPGADLLALREGIATAANSADKFAVADEWLGDHYRADFAPPQSIVELAKSLQEQPASKLKEILQSFDGSQKHLIGQFKKYIGLTPKQYQRVLRFNDVFVQMQSDQFLSWSDIAQLCGYSDQSHFIKEFKYFSGFNPETFLKADFPDEAANFFPLDREG